MPQTSNLSPELVQGVTSLARALVVATRTWALYPPEHPAVAAAIDRLAGVVQEVCSGGGIALGVTPDTLLVADIPLPAGNGPVEESAALLNDRDIIELSFAAQVPTSTLRKLLTVLNLDASNRREGGGPERIWETEGDAAIGLRQIDYHELLKTAQRRSSSNATTCGLPSCAASAKVANRSIGPPSSDSLRSGVTPTRSRRWFATSPSRSAHPTVVHS